MKILEPLIVIATAAFGFVAIVYIFYGVAQTSHDLSMVKSDKQLCISRKSVVVTIQVC
jgi:hypothetical protein